MKIFVTAKTNSKTSRLERIDDSHFNVWVSAPPVENKANEVIIQLLAADLDIPKTSITIKSGQTSKKKVFEVAE